MIQAFYDKLDNDHNLRKYLLNYLEDARDEADKVDRFIACAQLAGVEVQKEEINGFIVAGKEKVSQGGWVD